ncbi:MAG: hypothetical protein EBX64_12580, partial [Betaproteobacteria bacterium]|nr:hypothetical protein [Betaproteobacteria bacterium]
VEFETPSEATKAMAKSARFAAIDMRSLLRILDGEYRSMDGFILSIGLADDYFKGSNSALSATQVSAYSALTGRDYPE